MLTLKPRLSFGTRGLFLHASAIWTVSLLENWCCSVDTVVGELRRQYMFCKALDSMPRNEKKPQKEPPATSTEEEAELRLSVTLAAASMEANGNISPTELFALSKPWTE